VSSLLAPPLALYVHLPWCVRKCPYCDFNSHRLPADPPFAAYVDALLADLEQDLASLPEPRPLVSVFLGGGTPSLFPPEEIGRLLAGIRARLPLTPEAEITLEANPGTPERGRFAAYRSAGVNRFSLGVQSFDRASLAALGRIHGPEEAEAALAELAAEAPARFNVDLMWGLPGQDPALARADLDRALAHSPAHLSHYQLTLEPGTPFARRPPPLPEEEWLLAIESACRVRLEEAGLRRYEVSAYARPGAESVHNLNYWRYGDYLGIGAGAHGKITHAAEDRIVRTVKIAHPGAYLRASGGEGRLSSVTEVAGQERIFEFLLNALRLIEGFPFALFEQRTGMARSLLLPRLDLLAERGLIEYDQHQARASPRGLELLNEILSAFLP
jgi:oxygen-independent coproporphyrinogen-3 oxidase